MSRWLMASIVLLACVAGAVGKGDRLYVRTASAALRKAPASSGEPQAVLHAGDEVIWEGGAKVRPWQTVRFDGGVGYLRTAQLSPTRPVMESSADAGSGSAARFARDPGLAAAFAKLEAANTAVSDDAVAAHAEKAGVSAGAERGTK